MRNVTFPIFMLLSILFTTIFFSCEKDGDEDSTDSKDSLLVYFSTSTQPSEDSITIEFIIRGRSDYDYSGIEDCGVRYDVQNDLKAETVDILSVGSYDGNSFTVKLKGLLSNKTYYYCGYAVRKGVTYYGEVRSFKTKKSRPADDGNDVPTSGDLIDLGLSVKWASYNVGATKPEEYGGLYGWGDPTGELKWQSGDKYGDYYMEEDACCVLYGGMNPPSSICGTSLDIAHEKWGNGWRMPTSKEMQELIDKCTWKIVAYKNIQGRLVIGPSGNKIFLPATGLRDGAKMYYQGEKGRYWTGTLSEDDRVESYKNKLSYAMGFEKDDILPLDVANAKVKHYIGMSVRPVKNKQ